MTDRPQFDQYQEYLSRLEQDLGLTSTDSLEEAEAGWAIRRLSRSEFEELLNAAEKEDAALHRRWLRRLQLGYDREKEMTGDEIEERFAGVAIDDPPSGKREDAA
jgi:hypothetical protein